MKLSVSPPPYEGAPVVVFISGLGGSGSYWLPQLAALEPEYQVVCYDQLGTGNNPATLPEDYSLAQMADELARRWRMPGLNATASWVTRWGRWSACSWPSTGPTPSPRWCASTAG